MLEWANQQVHYQRQRDLWVEERCREERLRLAAQLEDRVSGMVAKVEG